MTQRRSILHRLVYAGTVSYGVPGLGGALWRWYAVPAVRAVTMVVRWVAYVVDFAKISVVTVIETGTETAVFLPNRTEPKPRFYASVLTVRF